MTDHKVLVCCYTNHALDQFLEDLVKQGIPEEHVVRLGSKPSPTTQCMALSAQTLGYNFDKYDWDVKPRARAKLGSDIGLPGSREL